MHNESDKAWWSHSHEAIMQELTPAGRTTSGSRFPFLALLAFTVILLLSPQSFLPVLTHLHLALLTGVLATLGYVIDCITCRSQWLASSPELSITTLLVGWAILSIPFSYWPGGSATFLFSLYLKSFVIFVLLSQIVTSINRLKIVIWCLSIMALPIAISGLRHFVAGYYIQLDGALPDDKRIFGFDAPLTQNPNDLALMLNLILPLTISLLFSCENLAMRLLLISTIALIVMAIIASFSRGGFLTLMITSMIYIHSLFKQKGQIWVLLIVLLTVSAIPLLPESYVDRLNTITQISSDPTGSAQTRWADLQTALQFVSSHPLMGAGVGVDYLGMNEIRGSGWQPVHNVYLQYAVELGIPGAALFVYLLIRCIKSMSNVRVQWSAYRSRIPLSDLAEGLRVSLIAFAVAAMFHPVGYHFYFYYIAGLAIATRLISVSTLHAAT